MPTRSDGIGRWATMLYDAGAKFVSQVPTGARRAAFTAQLMSQSFKRLVKQREAQTRRGVLRA